MAFRHLCRVVCGGNCGMAMSISEPATCGVVCLSLLAEYSYVLLHRLALQQHGITTCPQVKAIS
jgi:hypothetical protein